MGIRTSLNNLGSIFGVGGTTQVTNTSRSSAADAPSAAASDDSATLSSMGSAMATSSGSGVRPGKVASIQAAMAAGGYSVSASAVATKVVDSMLGAGA
jgi:flagellar biosynthesis anti-sigma factor FlgM